MHAGRRTLISREELSLVRQKLRENPEMEEGIMTAIDFLPVLRSRWEEGHPGGMWPGCHPIPAQRIGHRLGSSWRRAHGKKRSAADEERKAAFLEEIRQLLRTVPRVDVINADESAFLLYVAGAYRWARRGAEGVQIWNDGNVS
jgi:hypothetical protein